jgi:hypothetical protein
MRPTLANAAFAMATAAGYANCSRHDTRITSKFWLTLRRLAEYAD